MDPANSFAYYNRGITKDRMGDFEGAVADFSSAISLDPGNADFYHNRGFSLRKQVGACACVLVGVGLGPWGAVCVCAPGCRVCALCVEPGLQAPWAVVLGCRVLHAGLCAVLLLKWLLLLLLFQHFRAALRQPSGTTHRPSS